MFGPLTDLIWFVVQVRLWRTALSDRITDVRTEDNLEHQGQYEQEGNSLYIKKDSYAVSVA